MAWMQIRQMDRTNRKIPNIYTSRGSVEELSGYLFSADSRLCNFIISGGEAVERNALLYPYLDELAGKMPVIVLHAGSSMQGQANPSYYDMPAGEERFPIWVINHENKNFEPFYGMSAMQVAAVCRQLAAKLGYVAAPRLERVVKAHISILTQLDVPISLSGFYYLCRFDDMGEFYDNILNLPCGEDAAKRLWADLGAGTESENSQFDLFRNIINNLAEDAKENGWNPDRSVEEENCITAIDNQVILFMDIDNVHTNLLFTYLTAELKAAHRQDFVLLVDGVKLQEECFIDYILARGRGGSFGIVADDAVDLSGGNGDVFYKFAAKTDSLILFKHRMGKNAAFFSDAIGNYDQIKAVSSSVRSYGMSDILPSGYNQSVGYSTENRYRIMPEEITSLYPGQAIVFDTALNQIIRYN